MEAVRWDALRVGFDRSITLEFHGAKVSSDAGLFPHRQQTTRGLRRQSVAPLPKRSDRVSRPPSSGRTQPFTVDPGQKRATGP